MRRRRACALVQALISVALLALVFRNFDRGEFWRSMRGIPLWFYLVSLAVLALGQLVYTVKWLLVLRAMGRPVALGRLAQEYFVAIFANNFLPTMIGGDVARVYYLGRDAGYASVATSVVVDRALGFVPMTALGTVLLWWVPVATPPFVIARTVLSAMLALCVLALVLAGTVARRGPTLLLRRRGLARAADMLASFRDAARPLGRRPDVVLAALACVALYFALLTWVYRTYFHLAGAVVVDTVPLVTVLLAIAVLSNVPISLNGIGLREQLHVLLLAGLGLSRELAVGAAVMVFSQFLVLSVVGWILWRRRRAPRPAAPVPAPAPVAVIYDAGCALCARALALFRRGAPGAFTFADGNDTAAIALRFPMLAGADTHAAMFVITPDGAVFRGFFAFRRMLWASPWLFALLPAFYCPGASILGPLVYGWIARHRRRLGCATRARDLPPLLGREGPVR